MSNTKIIRTVLTISVVLNIVLLCASFNLYQQQGDKLETAETEVQDQESLDVKIAKIIISRRALEKARYEAKESMKEVTTLKENSTAVEQSVLSFVGKPISSINNNSPIGYVEVRYVAYSYYTTSRIARFSFKIKVKELKGVTKNADLVGAKIPLGYRIRGPTLYSVKCNNNLNKHNPILTMENIKKIKFSKRQKERLKVVAEHLFDFKHVKVEGDNLVLSDFHPLSPAGILSSQAVKIPLFEVIMTEFPRRLSIYAYGNDSFTPLYMTGLIYLLSVNPSAIADWVFKKFEKIKRKGPYSEKEAALYAVSSLLDEEEKEENSKFISMNKRVRRMSSTRKKGISYEGLKESLGEAYIGSL